ncbi:YidH family protein [Aliinostoc sp. HNIBRCY26]|uniref:YidH family protein n=1 Tax=Aliinostoc sp. HNIBRCY26 TaxID=3418997 RepID=UPI003D02ECCD
MKTETDYQLEKPKPKYRSDRIRDHLANERTYLAWMRSGIALMGFGVLIVRLRILRPPLAPLPPGNGWKLGLAFAVVGVLTVLLSTQHYFAVREDIDQETYQPPDRWIFLASLAVTLLGAGVIYYVFTIPLENLETYVLE